MLQPPSFTSPLHLLADFVELACIAEPETVFKIRKLEAHLKDAYDAQAAKVATRDRTKRTTFNRRKSTIKLDEEDDYSGRDDPDQEEDPEIVLEDIVDERAKLILDELDRRSIAAGSGYPFELSQDGRSIRRLEGTPARNAYEFCLLVSAYRKGDLLPHTLFAATSADVEELFQICGTVAGAGFVGGEAVSFNFARTSLPRAFLPALQSVYPTRFPEGRPKQSFMAADNRKVKDASVDVIAWRLFPDRRPGHIYMLGQCASGNDYTDKSILPSIRPFHEDWFVSSPRSHVIPALLIPFIAERDMPLYKGESYQEVADEYLLRLTRDYGTVLDRCRIAFCISSVDERADREGVDRYDDLARVSVWVAAIAEQMAVDAK